MFVALSPVAVDCFFPSSSSDTTAHSDSCLPPSNLIVFFLSLSSRHPFPRARTRSPTTSYPFLCPELALMPRYLPLLPILRTTRHLTTQTSVSLFSVFTFLYSIPFSRLLPVSPCPSRLGLSLASTRISFVIPLPPAASLVSLARLHRGMHDRHSSERITRTAFTQSTMLVPTV